MFVRGGDKQGEGGRSSSKGISLAGAPNAAVPPTTISMKEDDKPDVLDLVRGGCHTGVFQRKQNGLSRKELLQVTKSIPSPFIQCPALLYRVPRVTYSPQAAKVSTKCILPCSYTRRIGAYRRIVSPCATTAVVDYLRYTYGDLYVCCVRVSAVCCGIIWSYLT